MPQPSTEDMLEVCEVCCGSHATEECPDLGLAASKEVKAPGSRARMTLPHFLEVIDVNNSNDVAVIAKEHIPMKTQLGPFEAKRTIYDYNRKGIFYLKILSSDHKSITLDASDEKCCNWMALVQVAMTTQEQNLIAYQLGANVFFNTIRDIQLGVPLTVWYSSKYAEKLGQPVSPDGVTRYIVKQYIDIFERHSIVPELFCSHMMWEAMLGVDLLSMTSQPFSETVIASKAEDKLNGSVSTFLPSASSFGDSTMRQESTHAYSCCRCSGTFHDEDDFAMHLRGHLLPSSIEGRPKRRGRPWYRPNVSRPLGKRGPGRPRKYFFDVESVAGFARDPGETDNLLQVGNVEEELIWRQLLKHDVCRGGQSVFPGFSEASDVDVMPSDGRKFSGTGRDADGDDGGVNVDVSTHGNSSPCRTWKRKRGRPRKVHDGIRVEENVLTDSSRLSPVSSSRRVQPRRTLKGRRTSTFRYPGEEGSSGGDDDSGAGRNVLRQALRSESQYSDDDVNVSFPTTDDELEEGEVKVDDGFVGPSSLSSGALLSRHLDIIDNQSGEGVPGSTPIVSYSSTVSSDVPRILGVASNHSPTADGHNEASTVFATIQPAMFELGDGVSMVDEAAPVLDGSTNVSPAPALPSDELASTRGLEVSSVEMKSLDPDWLPNTEARPISKRSKVHKVPDVEATVLVIDGPDGPEYSCGVCSKRFNQLKYLKMHLPVHTDKFLCSECGRRFARHESLQKHVYEDGMVTYRCRECRRVFPQLDLARRHTSLHRGMWVCGECQLTFPHRQLLLQHCCEQEEDGRIDLMTADTEGDFPCKTCGLRFHSAKYLDRHAATHTEPFRCDDCGKCYSHKDSLQRHVLRCCPHLADDYGVLACKRCHTAFESQQDLEVHSAGCSDFRCRLCWVCFPDDDCLQSHVCGGRPAVGDVTGAQFPCTTCGSAFASSDHLMRHEESHHAEHGCDLCGTAFLRSEDLSCHKPVCLAEAAIQSGGQATCDVCQSQFNDATAFGLHHQTHTHPHKCTKCDKRFSKIGSLHTHRCDVGLPATPVEGSAVLARCDQCNKTFKNDRYLTRHKQLHGYPSFDCEHCGKKFTRKDYLNDHQCVLPDGTFVRVVRRKNRLYIRGDFNCSHCTKTFSSRSNLNKHMRMHGEKLAQCHICHKRFHYDSYLKHHIATVHDKQFQYQCTTCGKVFFSKTGLIAHIKQFHEETVTLFPCPECGKAFRQKGNMRTHLYSHTTEKNFKCDLCTREFKYPDQLNRHRLEHTLSVKLRCGQCDKCFVRQSDLRQHTRFFHSGLVYTCHVCNESCMHRHTITRHYRRKHPAYAAMISRDADFVNRLQRPAYHSAGSKQELLPIQLTSPSGDSSQILRVVTDDGHQEFIVTSAVPPANRSETSVTGDGLGDRVPTTITSQTVQDYLSQETMEALLNMGGAISIDSSSVIQQTAPDGSTVIILQLSQEGSGDSHPTAARQVAVTTDVDNGTRVQASTEATENVDGASVAMADFIGSCSGQSVFVDGRSIVYSVVQQEGVAPDDFSRSSEPADGSTVSVQGATVGVSVGWEDGVEVVSPVGREWEGGGVIR